ncbi:MAG: hypothetical protein KTR25_20525 [Myxococcales bacterium]|nr:hypothetical protein [Myxococcales bacterium]
MDAPEPDSDVVENLIYEWNAAPERDYTSFPAAGLHDYTLSAVNETQHWSTLSASERLAFLESLAMIGCSSAELGRVDAERDEYQQQLELAKKLGESPIDLDIRVCLGSHASALHGLLTFASLAGRRVSACLMTKDLEGLVPVTPDRVEQWCTAVDAIACQTHHLDMRRGVVLPVVSTLEDSYIYHCILAVGTVGMDWIVLEDVGRSVPPWTEYRTERLISFLANTRQRHPVIEWKGSNRYGLGVAVSLGALAAEIDRVHGTVLGIGPPGSHVPSDQLVLNIALEQGRESALEQLVPMCEFLAQCINWRIPVNYPLLGQDAFRTASGVHAAAIIKAMQREQQALADRVYSSIPAGVFGKKQVIELGPLSGMATVRYWLSTRGIAAEPELSQHLLAVAKRARRVLSEEEVYEAIAWFKRFKATISS